MQVYYSNLDYEENSPVMIEDASSDDEIVVIPDEIDGHIVEQISFSAFNFPNAKKIILPASLKEIEGNNFDSSACPNLEVIDMENTSIEHLGQSVFSQCENLQEIILPKSLKSTNKSFYELSSLKKVVIPESVEEMRDEFTLCNFDSLVIGDKVKTLSFGSNFKVKDISVSKKNKNFVLENKMLFSKDKKTLVLASTSIASKIILPKETEFICDNCFAFANISYLDISNVIDIGKAVFFSATIDTLIANKLLKTSSECFKNAHIKNIELAELTFLDEFLFENAKLDNLKLGDNLTTILSYAFFNAQLKKFVCPKNLQVIHSEAFASSGVEEVKFNEGLLEIGSRAFSNCLQNATIKLPNSLAILAEHAFDYSKMSSYFLPRDMEYINGIKIDDSVSSAPNIFVPVRSDELQAYYAGTNLENLEVSALDSVEELTSKAIETLAEEDGFSLSSINKFFKNEER